MHEYSVWNPLSLCHKRSDDQSPSNEADIVEPGFHTYEAVFTLSDNKDIELVKWCDDHGIEVPELQEFYFQRPSKFSKPYLTEADSDESAAGEDDNEA